MIFSFFVFQNNEVHDIKDWGLCISINLTKCASYISFLFVYVENIYFVRFDVKDNVLHFLFMFVKTYKFFIKCLPQEGLTRVTIEGGC